VGRGVALVVGLALVAPAARAAACAPGAALGVTDQRLAALDPKLRLRFIDAELARGAHRANVWVWGWTIALGVGTVGNLVPVPFVPADQRIDWYTGSVTTVIGIVPLFVAPPTVIADARELHAHLDARGTTDVCALLADAETRLVRDAENQADARRWWVHVGNVVLNAGVGLFLGLGYHHWVAGALNFASGAAIGEVIIFTQPTNVVDGLRRYRDGALDEAPGEALDDGAQARPSLSFSRAF
jgi:hypothetical protein